MTELVTSGSVGGMASNGRLYPETEIWQEAKTWLRQNSASYQIPLSSVVRFLPVNRQCRLSILYMFILFLYLYKNLQIALEIVQHMSTGKEKIESCDKKLWKIANYFEKI